MCFIIVLMIITPLMIVFIIICSLSPCHDHSNKTLCYVDVEVGSFIEQSSDYQLLKTTLLRDVCSVQQDTPSVSMSEFIQHLC